MTTKPSRSVVIASCGTQQEAVFLRNLLEANGVRSMIVADDYVGLPLPTSAGVQLLVLEADVEPAQQVLAEAHS